MAIDPALATEAFTKQAPDFDAIDAQNPLIGRMREIVRTAALRNMQSGQTLLELNAGTGIDSFFFASKGLKVLATDGANGMVDQLRTKNASHTVSQLEIQLCSFLELGNLAPRKFDHVFSNFGGLNCTEHFNVVLKDVDELLLPGGTCTLVIMPRFSPWELGAVLKGNFKLALRRWKNGTPAHLEGVTFPCFYYSPRYVTEHIGPRYEVVEQRAMSLVAPPPHMERFPTKWPRTMRILDRIEERVARWWPFRNWGDHFLIILQKQA